MEEWVTLLLRGHDALVCDKCCRITENQLVRMYMNVDSEIEEVLCEECWEKEQNKLKR